MKLRKLLAGAVGAVGATAVANRVLASRSESLEPFLPGDHGTYRWRGFDVAYTEAGAPEDPDLLLFHGINAAASSHEFHAVFERLSEQYHVIAPDLPGFGCSDRPPLLYSASLYETFVADAIADLGDGSPVVVGSSLTGAYVATAAQEVNVDELVLVCPTDTSVGGRRVWLRSLIRSPVVGEAVYNLVVSKPSLRYFNDDHGYHDIDKLTDEVLGHEWQSGHQPGARFAPASFISGFLDPEGDLNNALAELDAPVTLVWGREAEITPLSLGRELAETGDAGLVVFDNACLLPHVEHPEQFVETVRGDVEPEPVEA